MALNNSMPEPFDLNSLFQTSIAFDITGSYQVNRVYVMKAELIYEIIRAHTLLMEDPNIDTPGELVDLFTGFVDSPYDITWYASNNGTKIVERAAMQAAKQGNMFAIAEYIPIDRNDPSTRL
jgi:hypothetical protein